MASLGAPSLTKIPEVFKSDSSALSKVSDNSKGMLKVAAELKSPLDGMVSFFSSIDKNIKEVASKIGEQTGISRLMAKIMGKDLKLEEEAAARDKRGRSIGGAKSGVKGEDVKPLGEGILASLKDAFDNLIPKQEIGELGKILLLATGALILVKLAERFQNLIAPVLEFFFETLIPGFQELNATIMSSPTGYLGVGGLVVSTTLLVQTYGTRVRTFFSGIGTRITGALKAFKTMMFPTGYFKTVTSGFSKITAPLLRVGTFIKNLAKTIGSGVAPILKALPGVGAIGNFGKLFVRFLGPVGLIIQAFVGLFTGIKDAIAEFKESGSILGAIGAFFGGVFDAIIGSTLNLLSDILGFVVKKLGFEGLGEFISNLDFTTDGIMNGITFVIDKIKGFFIGIQDGFYTFINGAIKLYNKIPFVEDIPLLETKAMREGEKGSEGTNMAETMALKNRAAAEGDAVRLEKITSTNVTSINDTTTEKFDVKAENAKILKAEQAKLAEQQAAMRNFQNINAVNNSTGATTVNQTQVHSSGEPSTEHSDLTARHLIAASYA
jgi:hypothetical protein